MGVRTTHRHNPGDPVRVTGHDALAAALAGNALVGHGAIPAARARARALATAPGSQLRRLFVDATGKLLHVEPTRYRVTASLSRHIEAQYRTCTFPGCGVVAQRCDLDHKHPFGQGGDSCEENVPPACRRHHNEKTAGKWRIAGRGEHTVWISAATGRPYSSTPRPYPVPRRRPRDTRPGFRPRS